ncbi:MAG: penicillin-binding protein 2 [Candidatus Magasanikbacteria bacterium]|nr:penicillin-binding protein 2 [Candidatus Magasanikbacteria bacterium]
MGISNKKKWKANGSKHKRLDITFFIMLGIMGIVALRFGILMIISHSFYEKLASGSHEVYSQLFATRGSVYIQDSRTKEEFPLAINRDVFFVYANPQEIKEYTIKQEIDFETFIQTIVTEVGDILVFDEDQKEGMLKKLRKDRDPYEPIKKQVEEDIVDSIKEKELAGIHFLRQSVRYYPEHELASNVIGFLGKTEEGNDIGRYGIEGYWEKELAGVSGFFEGLKSAKGRWIPLGGSETKASKDGVDLLLTIDRTLQFHACDTLKKAMELYEAEDAALIIMDPRTGAIRSMCSFPDFDPNTYGHVETVESYNNATIFTPYEPGSIFKPITMAASLNEEVITAQSVFYDSGQRDAGCIYPIRNADGKVYKDQSMSGLLENSVNTGMVWVAEQVGKQTFKQYIEEFGFGIKQGILMDTEASGSLETLNRRDNDDMDCYTATASFGQGISVTPLQVVTAFSAIANGGTLFQPYIVEEIRHTDKAFEKTKQKELRRVISTRTAATVSSMMVNVVDKGHAKLARVPGYYVAGKTGTAQIAEKGIYIDATNHSFVGFAPVEDPQFVMIVKLGRPKSGKYSSATSAAVFGDIAQFILQYYGVAPTR